MQMRNLAFRGLRLPRLGAMMQSGGFSPSTGEMLLTLDGDELNLVAPQMLTLDGDELILEAA